MLAPDAIAPQAIPEQQVRLCDFYRYDPPVMVLQHGLYFHHLPGYTLNHQIPLGDEQATAHARTVRRPSLP
jgi:hypothetical protein